MRYTREVTDALDDGRPVVALESTIIAHGLPRPENLEVALAAEEVVREGGAVPATIAVVEGMVRIGLDREGLETIAGGDVVKCSARDLAVVMARRATGATTVAATATLAVRAGIAVFATGGLGGVHREARESWDESADLTTLGQTPITVVCAGVKSVLDVEATLERLETLNVTLLGYRTDRFPGFYLADSGFSVPWRVDSPEEVADVHHARAELGLGAIVVANPIEDPLDAELHETVLRVGSGGGCAGRRPRQGHHAVPARALSSRDGRREPSGERAAPAAQCRAGGADRARRGMSLVVLGDVMVDVIARVAGELARGSDTAAQVSVAGGGSAGNVAAWAAALGTPVALVCRVGDDAPRAGGGRGAVARRCRGARGGRRSAADRHLRRAGRARRRAHDAARPGRQ